MWPSRIGCAPSRLGNSGASESCGLVAFGAPLFGWVLCAPSRLGASGSSESCAPVAFRATLVVWEPRNLRNLAPLLGPIPSMPPDAVAKNVDLGGSPLFYISRYVSDRTRAQAPATTRRRIAQRRLGASRPAVARGPASPALARSHGAARSRVVRDGRFRGPRAHVLAGVGWVEL